MLIARFVVADAAETRARGVHEHVEHDALGLQRVEKGVGLGVIQHVEAEDDAHARLELLLDEALVDVG